MTALGDALGASVEIPVRNEPTALDLAERRRKTIESGARCAPFPDREGWPPLPPFGPACDRCAPDPCECPPCPECGDPILSDDPDLTHTPGTERYHASCCPDCNPGDPDA